MENPNRNDPDSAVYLDEEGVEYVAYRERDPGILQGVIVYGVLTIVLLAGVAFMTGEFVLVLYLALASALAYVNFNLVNSWWSTGEPSWLLLLINASAGLSMAAVLITAYALFTRIA